uniref:sigma-54-dependent transcriptional regulator n=1 Tax=Lachnoclostridium phocaeense TaxID=1871021 RepID=UPI0026DACAD0|nr:sigma-54 dependent transcriptional regulator [Lachnoclostridium phocaeense]
MNTDKSRLNILVVDDEEKQCKILKILLTSEGYYVRTANSADEALKRMDEEEADIVITDLRMGEKDGIELLESVLEKYKACKVILLTGYGSIENAVEAMKKGAWFYFIKGQGPEKLLEELRKLQKAHEAKYKGQMKEGFKGKKYMLETRNEKFQKVIRILERAAKSSANILILGESGVGKEVLADYVHQISRPDKKFIGVNCHALSDSLMESELFGHEKGAFTGAVGTYKGRFEAVEGGTLFLDEIGDIPLHVQSKLLRVLETRTIERVGSTRSIPVDFRLVSATNVDIENAIEEERFRSDLYYRLCTITVVVPPLRERKEDLPSLIRFFLEKYGEEQQKEMQEPSQEVWDALLSYSYKGNVRELRNIIERLVVLSENGEILAEDLPEQFFSQPVQKKSTGGSLKEIRAQAEKEAIQNALRENDYRIKETAEQLGIGERQLFYKLKEYGIDVKQMKKMHKI